MMCSNSQFIYFLLPSPSHRVLSVVGFENLFAIDTCISEKLGLFENNTH